MELVWTLLDNAYGPENGALDARLARSQNKPGQADDPEFFQVSAASHRSRDTRVRPAAAVSSW